VVDLQLMLLDQSVQQPTQQQLEKKASSRSVRAQRPLTPRGQAKWEQEVEQTQAIVYELHRVWQRSAVRGLTFCEMIQLWREANCV